MHIGYQPLGNDWHNQKIIYSCSAVQDMASPHFDEFFSFTISAALSVCQCSPHLSQTNFDRNRFGMGSLSEANLTKMSITIVFK